MSPLVKIIAWLMLLGTCGCASTRLEPVCERTEIDLSGAGWRLWQDKDATWKEDELFLPGTDLAKIPTNPPTGGWDVLRGDVGIPVAVPGTAEQYLQQGDGPSGDITGVTWWYRTIEIPPAANRRTLLRFAAARQRAEVYLDGRLVGYDLVGNTPFEVDLSAALEGDLRRSHQLAVRITDFGGNFDWKDSNKMAWGKHFIPASHGFGGVSGRVKLISVPLTYIDDVYVQNTPAMRTVNVFVTLRNTTKTPDRRDVAVNVLDEKTNEVIAQITQKDIAIQPGVQTVKFTLPAADAKLWDLDSPNLYVCRASLRDGEQTRDVDQRVFGFRWFSPEGIGSNAVFRLNGKRIVLRTAISWGFWPVTGLFPTPELAEKEIRTAKALGQNMLNFHRTIGNPISFELADRLGLLIYEEPGGYRTGDDDAFAGPLATEKLLRMVKRDRSHPSLVLYNMINEWNGEPGPVVDAHARDMRSAHALDPSRTITHTSGWAKGETIEHPSKMHMRPFDDTLHLTGWFDFHHAGGPETWNQGFYKNPGDYYNRTTNQQEIVYWGEEGAISSPPQLGKIRQDIERPSQLGWDSKVYLDWNDAFERFLDRKNLRSAFPAVDDLSRSMGNISLYHQGRKIEQMRLGNVTDGYAVNGWEAEIVENHSGIVDCYRNPKGDASIMAHYNQPLFVAVKSRSDVVETSGKVMVDFYAINEVDLRGDHVLSVSVKDLSGKVTKAQDVAVKLEGGEQYGQLLCEGIAIDAPENAGIFEIRASLRDGSNAERATGAAKVLAVNCRDDLAIRDGALWEAENRVGKFLASAKNVNAPTYADDLPPLKWVMVARPPDEGAFSTIPAQCYRLPDASAAGLSVSFIDSKNKDVVIHQRVDASVDLAAEDGAAPDPAVPLTERYIVRWRGQIIPQVSGKYTLQIQSSSNIRLSVDGKMLTDTTTAKPKAQVNKPRVDLTAGKPVAIELELHQHRGAALCKLTWAVPEANPPSPQRLLDRVKNDGTTMLLLDRADTWMELISKTTGVQYSGSFQIGRSWLGGSHFVRAHPLFEGLPVNTAMDWPYQSLVRDGNGRSGLLLEGEELVAGAYHSYPMKLGTAVGVIRYGRGRIVFSTLDICGTLDSTTGPSLVAKRLLFNCIRFADRP